MPTNARPGRYIVAAECTDVNGQTLTRTQDLIVTGAGNGGTSNPGTGASTGTGSSSGSRSGGLPRTGSELNGIALVGAGLLAVGGLVLLSTRKRRNAAA